MSEEDDAAGAASEAMPAFVKLLVTDAARSRGFYQALGFELRHADQVFTHLRWRDANVFLVATPPGLSFASPRGAGVIVCFSVVAGDLETIAARAQGAGAAVDGPREQPWHTRELVVTDPDGFRLAFVQPA